MTKAIITEEKIYLRNFDPTNKWHQKIRKILEKQGIKYEVEDIVEK